MKLSLRALWLEFDFQDLDPPGPPNSRPGEARPSSPNRLDEEWGRSESLDPDDIGDIADEGLGHRG